MNFISKILIILKMNYYQNFNENLDFDKCNSIVTL